MTPLYTLLYAVTLGTATIASPLIPKLRRGISQRRGLNQRMQKTFKGSEADRPIWFHVASSGEFEQCLPILDRIRAESPNVKILLTYFSPSGERAVTLETERRKKSNLSLPWDIADFAPFDLPWSVESFLQITRPRAFVAIHREIWPNLLEACEKQTVPCFLFAAFFPEKTWRNFWIYRPWIRFFHWIGTVDHLSLAFLEKEVPASKVARVGDPRIERVLARRKMKTAPPWSEFFQNQRVVVGASLWPKDFEALKPALKVAVERKTRLILVPHEPHGKITMAMLEWMKGIGQTRLWSSWTLSPDAESHLIVDSVGILAELYADAHFVFVGGSFVGRIHNVLEPAAYGKPILAGPYIWNSAQALEWDTRGLGLKSVSSPEELTKYFEELLTNPQTHEQWSHFLTQALESERTVSERYVSQLRPYLL